MRLFVYDMLVNVNVIYYVHVCEQARWACSAGNSAIENLCIIIIIYWPKSYILVLFIIIVKVGVVPTKTDWKRHESDRRNRERKQERKKGEWQKKKKKIEQIPDFVSDVRALSVEIRTGNCSKSITL